MLKTPFKRQRLSIRVACMAKLLTPLDVLTKHLTCDPHAALRATLSQWERDNLQVIPSPIGRGWREAPGEGRIHRESLTTTLARALRRDAADVARWHVPPVACRKFPER